MSLSALVYNFMSPVTFSADLKDIMNIGKELYSVLSRLHNQYFLLLTELPNMVTVFETNYQIQYSPSYTGGVHDVSSSIDFLFCMLLGMLNIGKKHPRSLIARVDLFSKIPSIYIQTDQVSKSRDSKQNKRVTKYKHVAKYA